MIKYVDVQASDGGTFKALVSHPETDLPAPAVVVIQEIFGINANMRGVCEQLSHAGFVTICPDLFWRQEPNVVLDDKNEADWQKALKLFQGFDVDKGIEDLKATVAYIRQDKETTGKVATVGYCLGGKLAFLMATRSDADCNVSYYGVGIDELLGEVDNIHKPLLMHIAENDRFVPLAAQEKILHALNKAKGVEIHVYPDVDHAFARIDGQHYDKEAAHQANFRTADFLASHLVRRRK